jgi:hypothetical protein
MPVNFNFIFDPELHKSLEQQESLELEEEKLSLEEEDILELFDTSTPLM